MSDQTPYTPSQWQALLSELSAWQKHTGDAALANLLARVVAALSGLHAEREKWRVRCAEETIAWADATKRADTAEARWRAAEDECRAVQARLDDLLVQQQGGVR